MKALQVVTMLLGLSVLVVPEPAFALGSSENIHPVVYDQDVSGKTNGYLQTVHAGPSELIKSDIQALKEARASGDAARIMAAETKLEQDLAAEQERARLYDKRHRPPQWEAIVKSDRQALKEAKASRVPLIIKAAKEKLKADIKKLKLSKKALMRARRKHKADSPAMK